MSHDDCLTIFLCHYVGQVEFNKAAQSLSEALVPTTKKAALTRLLKVRGWLG